VKDLGKKANADGYQIEWFTKLYETIERIDRSIF
jgi:hypothetical protein